MESIEQQQFSANSHNNQSNENDKQIERIVWSKICSIGPSPTSSTSLSKTNIVSNQITNETILDPFIDLSIPTQHQIKYPPEQDQEQGDDDEEEDDEKQLEGNYQPQHRSQHEKNKSLQSKLLDIIQTNNFLPVSGIETLQRRKRRSICQISKGSEVIIEKQPWSTKKSKSFERFFQQSTFNENFNWNPILLGENYSDDNQDQDQIQINEEKEEFENEIDESKGDISLIIKNHANLLVNQFQNENLDNQEEEEYEKEKEIIIVEDDDEEVDKEEDKYINLGIIRYQPQLIISQNQNPFQLPKKL